VMREHKKQQLVDDNNVNRWI